jgi:cysteate synthase
MYRDRQLKVRTQLPGLFQFSDWLPVDRSLNNVVGKPITYESKRLAAHLKLDRLFICFNGYWPERNAHLYTGSFKELEAPAVLARVPANHPRTLVISSAGNTGRAFANICSQQQLPLCLVIPEQNLSAIWSKEPFHPNICLVVVSGGGDYTDAIELGRLISRMAGFFPEGGAANVGRRDGMGLTVLDAAVTMGQIPDHYFQAVGSGTGGISAWEANLRLLEDGRFGSTRMRLHLAQNSPFTPMVEAWRAKSRWLPLTSEAVAREQIRQVSAQVLTNRQPAYSLTGGVYEALAATNGEMYAVTNEESEYARMLFAELEGIDISPASGVATAALIQAAKAGNIKQEDAVLLNITSGGCQRMEQDYSLHYLQPDVVFLPQEIEPEIVAKRMEKFLPVSARRCS